MSSSTCWSCNATANGHQVYEQLSGSDGELNYFVVLPSLAMILFFVYYCSTKNLPGELSSASQVLTRLLARARTTFYSLRPM